MDRSEKMNLAEANAAGHAAFADIAEHSPWVADHAFRDAPFDTREAMIASFTMAVHHADPDDQLALLRAHPDLATRARLTLDSTNEQKGAGLDNLSAGEFARFTDLNEHYKRVHGFPFIFAVKGATKQQILAGFEERIHNTREKEFATALDQVCRIIRFRLEDRVQE
jgi:2-oxo-4-hydroxy-4-carboxy-5-ureidoimidazoline decarboxylase